MGVLWLSGSLVNLVKLRMEERYLRESVARLGAAKNESWSRIMWSVAIPAAP